MQVALVWLGGSCPFFLLFSSLQLEKFGTEEALPGYTVLQCSFTAFYMLRVCLRSLMLLSRVVYISENELICESFDWTSMEFLIFICRMLIISLVALLPAFDLSFLPSSSSSIWPRSPVALNYKSHISLTLTTITFASLLTTLYRLPRATPTPFKPGPRIVTSGIWTIHFGIDNEGHDSQQGMMNLIRDMKLDIVGLLETDLHVSCCLFSQLEVH